MAKKKEPEVSLITVAEEMNRVMAYGQDPKTGKVDESELIDTDLTDRALKAEIIKRAEEDLRATDEEDFSSEVWTWLLQNGVVPAGYEGNGDGIDSSDDPDNGNDDNPDDGDAENGDDAPDADEPEPDDKPKAKKTPQKAASPAPKTKTQGKGKAAGKTTETGQDGESKRVPPIRTMVEGGNENYAKTLVQKKVSYDEFHAAFHKLYKEAGKEDEDYIKTRCRIYWNIAHKALGITPTDGPAKSRKKVAEEKPAPKVAKPKGGKEVKGKHK